ncbi:MAG TPA: hypothetical protein VMV49_12385 [Candidatus Deferrimicrobium sp.]|nr:hypothetical protein [Candidatus Deferrimicrobium sp.]
MEKVDLVGKSIPELNLPDTRGRTINLKTFIDQKNAIFLLLKGVT